MRRSSIALLLICALGLLVRTATAQEAAGSEKPASAGSALKASEPQAKDLMQLLELVKHGLDVERIENQRRIEAFQKAKQDQARLLAESQASLHSKEALSQQLEQNYNENEASIGELQNRLTERLGQLGELFGVVRQVATDTAGHVWDSLISSQVEPRQALLERLGRSTELPSTDDLEKLWYELQREMTLQGQVVRYSAPVLTTQGQVEQQEVVRAGPFSAVARGRYLLWEPSQEKLRELIRQPPSRYLNTVEAFEATKSGFAPLAVDPSRGSLLNALTDTPDFWERLQQGGYVGYTTIALGILALVLGLLRWVIVTITGRKVSAQRKTPRLDAGNPLGRVLSVYQENRERDTETLELKLDEAVLRETAQLERFMWVVKTVSVVAPLLGLLGTVTGMIKTFQAITLFGAGDPKMMAGGISEALVTTMIGLTIAIPLVLLYDLLSNSTRRITDVLDEQTAGLIATRSEELNA